MRTALVLCLVFAACGAKERPKTDTQKAMEEIGKAGGSKTLKTGDRLREVPPFKLLERAGVPASNETLKGKVWVAAFIFTSCKTHCVMMCTQMYQLQEDFKDDPDFVCVATTVDPARDTPEKLTRFAKSYSARGNKWLFLTGDRDAIRDFAHEGMKITWQKDEPLVHSTRFVLVDRDGWIRGWFDGADNESVDELKKTIKQVLAEKKTP